jgi:AraC family transcriptional regulator
MAIFWKSNFDPNPDLPPRKRRQILKVAIIILQRAETDSGEAGMAVFRRGPGVYPLGRLAQYLNSTTNVSEVVGLLQSRIVRGFKASTGVAPYMWVTHARIQKAKALLADNRMPLFEVALERVASGGYRP